MGKLPRRFKAQGSGWMPEWFGGMGAKVCLLAGASRGLLKALNSWVPGPGASLLWGVSHGLLKAFNHFQAFSLDFGSDQADRRAHHESAHIW